MKKLLLGALAALGLFGAYKLNAAINPTSPQTQGLVVSVDRNANSFQIEVNENEGLQMVFYVTPQTQFVWLANSHGGSNKATFLDVLPNVQVSVIYTTNDNMTESVAERVIIEAIK